MTSQTKDDLSKVEEILAQRLCELRDSNLSAKEDVNGGKISRYTETLTLTSLHFLVRLFM